MEDVDPSITESFLDNDFEMTGTFRQVEGVQEHFLANPLGITDEFDFNDYVNYCIRQVNVFQNEHTEHSQQSEESEERRVGDAKVIHKKLSDTVDFAAIKPIWTTIENTTQWGRTTQESYLFRMHYKSPALFYFVPRRNEPVALDSVYSDTSAIDGSTCVPSTIMGLKPKSSTSTRHEDW